MSQTLRFGSPIGSAGVVIYQNTRDNQSVTSQYGAAAMFGITKRGPMGKAIPVRGSKQYQEIFGDSNDKSWHLFANSDHLTPDAIDGFFAAGGDSATLFVTRLELDGKARKSELTINGRNGTPVLKITAANEGRWGGTRTEIAAAVITAVTTLTLTVIAPGLLAGEYRGGIILIANSTRKYTIVSNTAAATNGEAVFTVAAQFNLVTDGVSTASLANIALDPALETDGLAVSISQGILLPETHFSMSVYFNGRQVMQLNDLSLDPADKYFVEDVVAVSNVAYDDGSESVPTYITATSLWMSAYTTQRGSDVRPSSGNGSVLAVEGNKIYTVAAIDYGKLVGELLYPSAYESPSNYYRITTATAPATIAGNYTTLGTAVNGISTLFTTKFAAGDYLYNSALGAAVKIASVNSDVSMTLATAFSSDAFTSVPTKCGSIGASINSNLTTTTVTGDEFILSVRKYLTGGYDGDTANLNNNYWLKYADPDLNHLETAASAVNAGLVRVICPGISDSSIQRAFAEYCNLRAYEYRIEVPSYMNANQAEAFLRNEIGKNDAITMAYPSYGYSNNPLVSNRDRLTPLNGDILGGESAKAIADGGYHKMLAGLNYSLPNRIVRLVATIDAREEANLNQRGIQPIKKVDGRFCLWGIRAPSTSEQFKFINCSRIQKNLIRVFRESSSLLGQLFQLNEPNTITQLVFILNDYARKEFDKGVFTRFLPFTDAVKVNDLANSTGDSAKSLVASLIGVENGKLSLSFVYTPSGLLELIEIYVTPDATAGKFGSAANTAF